MKRIYLMDPAFPVRYSRTGGHLVADGLIGFMLYCIVKAYWNSIIFEDYELSLPAIVSFRVA